MLDVNQLCFDVNDTVKVQGFLLTSSRRSTKRSKITAKGGGEDTGFRYERDGCRDGQEGRPGESEGVERGAPEGNREKRATAHWGNKAKKVAPSAQAKRQRQRRRSLNVTDRTMKVLLAMIVLGGSLCMSQTPDLRSVHKVYIEKMPNDLDLYLRAEIGKQFKGKLTVVLKKEDADGIITGVNDEQKGTAAKVTGRYLGLHDTVNGTISLLDQRRATFSGPMKRVSTPSPALIVASSKLPLPSFL